MYPRPDLAVLNNESTLVIFVVFYLVITVPIYKIAERMNQHNAWLAFVPVANLCLMVNMARKPWWWVILLFIPLIGLVATVIISMAIAENLGHPSWMGILMIIPLVNLAVLYYWAFGTAPVRN